MFPSRKTLFVVVGNIHIWYMVCFYDFLNIHKILCRITDLVFMVSSGRNTQF